MSASDESLPTAPRRPESARPRQDRATEQSAAAPPTAEELEAIERHRTDWMGLLGAAVEAVANLGVVLIRPAAPTTSLSYVTGVRWLPSEVDGRLKGVSEMMRSLDLWPSIVTSEGLTQPPDLAQRLAAAGWIRASTERIMWTRHPTEPPHLEPGLRIEAVTGRTAVECARLEAQNFGLPADALDDSARLLADAIERGATRAYLVRRGREAVASARLVPGPVVAGLHAVGVLPAYRGRGYGRLVTTVATRAGLATRHRLVWLSVDESNDVAVGLYRSLDFAPAFDWTRWLAPS